MAILTGCANVGHISGETGTSVRLSEKNYKLIKAGAMGRSLGFSLLWFIPIVPPTSADAKNSLYKSVGESLTGRAIALANQTYDNSKLNFILFSFPRITVTADVIEFTDEPAGGGKTSE